MAYSSYRYHANSGPTRVNRTSWGPASHTQIDVPNKIYERRLSGNYDRIINSFDRTNAFECVRSAFEQACSKNAKEIPGVKYRNDNKQETTDKNVAINVKASLVSRSEEADTPKEPQSFQKHVESEPKDRFIGHSDMIVNGKGSCALSTTYERAEVDAGLACKQGLSSSFERAEVDGGLACKQTPCTDEDVTAYYQDKIYMSQARQLYPLQEDLADWINKTIGEWFLIAC